MGKFVYGQRIGSAPAEVDPASATCQVGGCDFPQYRRQVLIFSFFCIPQLVEGTEGTEGIAKRNMNIDAESITEMRLRCFPEMITGFLKGPAQEEITDGGDHG